jgi:hypothetical protein
MEQARERIVGGDELTFRVVRHGNGNRSARDEVGERTQSCSKLVRSSVGSRFE